MRKPTARRPSRRTVSRANHKSGLIADAKPRKRSASTKCALDNHSHRTPQFSGKGFHKSARGARTINSSFVSCNVR